MHVVATNIILWIRTLIKETMEEVSISPSTRPKKLDHFTIKSIYLLKVKLSSLFGTSLMILTLGIRDRRTTDEDSKLYSKL